MKNFSYYLFFLLLNNLIIGQTVTIKSFMINSQYAENEINLSYNSITQITLTTEVNTTTPPNDSSPNTINLYYKKSPTDVPIAVAYGGSLLFYGTNKATRVFNFSLNADNFNTTGGFLYAEFKTNSGFIYKSENLPITKSSSSGNNTPTIPTDATNPATITNTICCNQTIRQGDKPAPIIGSIYENKYANTPYGINTEWNITNSKILNQNFLSETLQLDYALELKNITITRNLGYTYTMDFPNKSNLTTITVIPSPITSNTIYVNAPTNTDGAIEIINTNPKKILGQNSFVNLKILENPFYITQRSDQLLNVDRYEWEFTNTDINGLIGYNNWQTINGENSSTLNSFNPDYNSNSEENYYLIRRIAIYGNIKRCSNILKLVLRTVRDNNTICCDQILELSPSFEIERPSIITGPITISDKNTYLFYQWQQNRIITTVRDNVIVSDWVNIPNATSKDYYPPEFEFVNPDRNKTKTLTYNYRRIATDYSYKGETYYSNEISLTTSIDEFSYPKKLLLYPNPAISVINIENIDENYDLVNSNITITNLAGVPVNSNNFTIINQNLISINISNLMIGTYFITVKPLWQEAQIITFIKNN